MTTANAVFERSLDEERRKLREENADLKERLNMTHKALKEVIETKLTEMDSNRSKRVLAEREACAKVCDDFANRFIKDVGPSSSVAINVAVGIRTAIIKRGEE
jgi:hypothetical protein